VRAVRDSDVSGVSVVVGVSLTVVSGCAPGHTIHRSLPFGWLVGAGRPRRLVEVVLLRPADAASMALRAPSEHGGAGRRVFCQQAIQTGIVGRVPQPDSGYRVGELVRGGLGGDPHGVAGSNDGQPLLDADELASSGNGIG
jgi:hypothetical protein